MQTERQDVYTRVTNRIVADLEQGTRTWMKPWNAGHTAGRITRPLRHNSQPYSGINILMLWASAIEQGFTAPIWMTFKQALELKANGGKAILIDGGHPGDFNGQPGFLSIPAQLEQILGPPPFRLSLLVVTHCHIDHIGCLPKMVTQGLLEVEWALVADEKLGWGKRIDAPDSHIVPDDSVTGRVVAALREEPRADDFEDDATLEQFLSDSVTLEQQYNEMLNTLEQNGVRVVRYGRDDSTALAAAHASTGMEILGPTNAHLEICRRAQAFHIVRTGGHDDHR